MGRAARHQLQPQTICLKSNGAQAATEAFRAACGRCRRGDASDDGAHAPVRTVRRRLPKAACVARTGAPRDRGRQDGFSSSSVRRQPEPPQLSLISDSFMPPRRGRRVPSRRSRRTGARWRRRPRQLMRDMPSMLRTGASSQGRGPMTGSLTEAMPSAMLVHVGDAERGAASVLEKIKGAWGGSSESSASRMRAAAHCENAAPAGLAAAHGVAEGRDAAAGRLGKRRGERLPRSPAGADSKSSRSTAGFRVLLSFSIGDMMRRTVLKMNGFRTDQEDSPGADSVQKTQA